MNNRPLGALLLFLLSFSSFSQNNWYHYKWDSENYDDFKKICNEAYNYNINAYSDNIYVGEHYKEFCFDAYTELYEELYEGSLYFSFDDAEKYVKKVLQTLVTDTSVTNRIKIFFQRDSRVNAFMRENGILAINVGLMARLSNEAELAMVLGHEIAHFIHQDAVKMHGHWLDTRKYYAWAAAGTFWYSREQEASADFESIRYIRESPYSLPAAGNLYRLFKREEIRNQIKYGKQNNTYNTHPDPGNRLQMVRNFSVDSLDWKKKSFVVDSEYFCALKKICYMETVNIDLEGNNLEELITLTFSNYLMEPDHAENLSVLIEALRRYLVLATPHGGDKRSFILSAYQTQKDPEALTHYGFLLEKNPSILNNLSKGLVDIWREDLVNIAAKDLADPEIVEFTTYAESFEYFKNVAATNKIRLAEHYKYFTKNTDFADVESYLNINSVFSSNDYLAQKGDIPAEGNSAVVIFPLRFPSLRIVCDPQTVLSKRESINYELVKMVWEENGGTVSGLERFSFADQYQLRRLFNLCWGHNIVKENESSKTKSENWLEYHPELYSFFMKRQISQLYFCYPFIKSVTKGNDRDVMCAIFYKICLPATGKPSIVGEYRSWDIIASEDESAFLEKLAKKYSKFIKRTS